MPVQVNRDFMKPYICAELLGRDNENTPDYLELKMEKHIPVFVYGTLKAGGRFHEVLGDAPCLGDGHTATPTYVMREASGGFPVVTQGKSTSLGSEYIYGEVYIVDARMMLELDRIEGNNEMYQRTQKFIFLCDQSFKGKGGMIRPSIKAWMYLGMEDFWSGLPLTNIKPKKMDGTKTVYEYQNKASSLMTYPSTVQPESKYTLKGNYSRDGGWDAIAEDDAMWWREYDEQMAARNPQQLPWAP